MAKILKWAYLWVVSLVIMMAGIGAVENPDNPILMGIAVLYGGMFLMVFATVKMAQKGA